MAKDSPTSNEPCYSMRLLIPFVRVLERRDQLPEARQALAALDPDERIPIATVHEWLEVGTKALATPDYGLLAAQEVTSGDYGAVEYAARTAATWGEAFQVVGRYMRLINDALVFSSHDDGERSVIRLESQITLPRAAADFQSGAFHVSASRYWSSTSHPDFEAWFTHPQPDDISEYERTFSQCTLRFGAAFNGFVFNRAYKSEPVPSADPQLHQLIRAHADTLLASLPKAQSVTEHVRELLAKELAGGDAGIVNIARQIPMGARTLGRRLEEEGTTFKELLDELRKHLAVGYVAGSQLALSEIAFLLGFSQTAAFHRAFKRWTTMTPLEYRRAHRR
ncbi:MAG: AraC family transcriptional regulator ligand-binding domain-containing protein [Polyangiales bacterium]